MGTVSVVMCAFVITRGLVFSVSWQSMLEFCCQSLLELPELQNKAWARRLALLICEDSGETVSFQRMVLLFTVLHENCPVKLKAAWAFALWDFDGNSPA